MVGVWQRANWSLDNSKGIEMGNKREEEELGKYMPASFKNKCPVCKTDWKIHTVELKMQIECLECRQARINRGEVSTWDAVSGCYTASAVEAWQKMWRGLVMRFGLRGSIAMCGSTEPQQVG